MKSPNVSAANVVCLETHPAWHTSQRRSQELLAAMRRHPSYQGRLPASDDVREDAVVISLCGR